MKAATIRRKEKTAAYEISIHAAREGGDTIFGAVINVLAISIHAAREGGDLYSNQIASLQGIFQSTPPVKAATVQQPDCKLAGHISIHAAREGGDVLSTITQSRGTAFQSTPPVKAATAETNRRNQHFRKQQV